MQSVAFAKEVTLSGAGGVFVFQEGYFPQDYARISMKLGGRINLLNFSLSLEYFIFLLTFQDHSNSSIKETRSDLLDLDFYVSTPWLCSLIDTILIKKSRSTNYTLSNNNG